jgi:prepilin-type N-terminal cleavage/methylation domain-containing protein
MKKGFTLIETLLVILLVGVASGAFLLGFAQAQLTLQSIKMKDRAHQELKEYTENIKSLVASGVQNFNSNQIGGIPVPIVSDASGQAVIVGNLYKNVRLCRDNVCPE